MDLAEPPGKTGGLGQDARPGFTRKRQRTKGSAAGTDWAQNPGRFGETCLTRTVLPETGYVSPKPASLIRVAPEAAA